MLVRELMDKVVQTLTPDHRIYHAVGLMEEHGIRHIPMVDKDDRLVGIVSDRDIKRQLSAAYATDEESMSDRLVMLRGLEDIMTTAVVTVTPKDTIRMAAARMLEERISAVPVVDEDGHVCGIVTTTDILRLYLTQ
jgi:acetoin utilization protein AcuB